MRVQRQQFTEAGSHTPVKLVVFGLQPVRDGVQTTGTDGVVQVQEQREVGEETTCSPDVERDDVVVTEIPPVTLVGKRGVEIAVAEHYLPVRQRRPDDLIDQVRPRSGIEERLGARGHAMMPGVEQHVSDSLAHLCTAGFAAHKNHVPPLPQRGGQ